MALVIWNPTNEKLETQYIGETVVLIPDQKLRVDDARGRHLLNVLGPRGLTSLEYGDDGDIEEKKKKDGRKRNMDFKRQQVTRYNQENQRREQAKAPIIEPPEQIKQYAKEIGVKLIEPYAYHDADTAEIASQKQELLAKDDLIASQGKTIDKLQTQMGDLSDKFSTLMATLEAKGAATEKTDVQAKTDADLANLRNTLGYVHLNQARFVNWIARNWTVIHDDDLPPEILGEIEDKWKRFYNKPFPTEKPEEEAVSA